MAGAASGWVKATSGPIKGTAVFVPPSVQQQTGITKEQILAQINQGAGPVLMHIKRPKGVAKHKAPSAKQLILVTQANGEKGVRLGVAQGNLAVVDTPYGHSVIHLASGKALLYVGSQGKPTAASEQLALMVMAQLAATGDLWGAAAAEQLPAEAQAALKTVQSDAVKPNKKLSFVAPAPAPVLIPAHFLTVHELGSVKGMWRKGVLIQAGVAAVLDGGARAVVRHPGGFYQIAEVNSDGSVTVLEDWLEVMPEQLDAAVAAAQGARMTVTHQLAADAVAATPADTPGSVVQTNNGPLLLLSLATHGYAVGRGADGKCYTLAYHPITGAWACDPFTPYTTPEAAAAALAAVGAPVLAWGGSFDKQPCTSCGVLNDLGAAVCKSCGASLILVPTWVAPVSVPAAQLGVPATLQGGVSGTGYIAAVTADGTTALIQTAAGEYAIVAHDGAGGWWPADWVPGHQPASLGEGLQALAATGPIHSLSLAELKSLGRPEPSTSQARLSVPLTTGEVDQVVASLDGPEPAGDEPLAIEEEAAYTLNLAQALQALASEPSPSPAAVAAVSEALGGRQTKQLTPELRSALAAAFPGPASYALGAAVPLDAAPDAPAGLVVAMTEDGGHGVVRTEDGLYMVYARSEQGIAEPAALALYPTPKAALAKLQQMGHTAAQTMKDKDLKVAITAFEAEQAAQQAAKQPTLAGTAVAVSQLKSGGGIICPKCGTENGLGRVECSSCGTNLLGAGVGLQVVAPQTGKPAVIVGEGTIGSAASNPLKGVLLALPDGTYDYAGLAPDGTLLTIPPISADKTNFVAMLSTVQSSKGWTASASADEASVASLVGQLNNVTPVASPGAIPEPGETVKLGSQQGTVVVVVKDVGKAVVMLPNGLFQVAEKQDDGTWAPVPGLYPGFVHTDVVQQLKELLNAQGPDWYKDFDVKLWLSSKIAKQHPVLAELANHAPIAAVEQMVTISTGNWNPKKEVPGLVAGPLAVTQPGSGVWTVTHLASGKALSAFSLNGSGFSTQTGALAALALALDTPIDWSAEVPLNAGLKDQITPLANKFKAIKAYESYVPSIPIVSAAPVPATGVVSVSVPTLKVGGGIACPKCGTENGLGRLECSQCGTSLLGAPGGLGTVIAVPAGTGQAVVIGEGLSSNGLKGVLLANEDGTYSFGMLLASGFSSVIALERVDDATSALDVIQAAQQQQGWQPSHWADVSSTQSLVQQLQGVTTQPSAPATSSEADDEIATAATSASAAAPPTTGPQIVAGVVPQPGSTGIPCPKCSTVNGFGRTHCSNCGTPLAGLSLGHPTTVIGEHAAFVAEGVTADGSKAGIVLTAENVFVLGSLDANGEMLVQANGTTLPELLTKAGQAGWSMTHSVPESSLPMLSGFVATLGGNSSEADSGYVPDYSYDDDSYDDDDDYEEDDEDQDDTSGSPFIALPTSASTLSPYASQAWEVPDVSLQVNGVPCPHCLESHKLNTGVCPKTGVSLAGQGHALGVVATLAGENHPLQGQPAAIVAETIDFGGKAVLAMLADGSLVAGIITDQNTLAIYPTTVGSYLPSAIAAVKQKLGWDVSAHIPLSLASQFEGQLAEHAATTQVATSLSQAAFVALTPEQALGTVLADSTGGAAKLVAAVAEASAASGQTKAGIFALPDGTFQSFSVLSNGAMIESKPYKTWNGALKQLVNTGYSGPLLQVKTIEIGKFKAKQAVLAGVAAEKAGATAWTEQPTSLSLHIDVSSSSPTVDVQGFVDGPLCVFQYPGQEGWVLGHVGSGYPIATGFASKDAAVAALGVAKLAPVNWNYSSKGELKANGANFAAVAKLGSQMKALAAASVAAASTAAAAAPAAAPTVSASSSGITMAASSAIPGAAAVSGAPLFVDGPTCPQCGTQAQGWRESCSRCGTKLHGTGATIGTQLTIGNQAWTILAEGETTSGIFVAMLGDGMGGYMVGYPNSGNDTLPFLSSATSSNIPTLSTALQWASASLTGTWSHHAAGFFAEYPDGTVIDIGGTGVSTASASPMADEPVNGAPALTPSSAPSETDGLVTGKEIFGLTTATAIGKLLAADNLSGAPSRLVVAAVEHPQAGTLALVVQLSDGSYQSIIVAPVQQLLYPSKPYKTIAGLQKGLLAGGYPKATIQLSKQEIQAFLNQQPGAAGSPASTAATESAGPAAAAAAPGVLGMPSPLVEGATMVAPPKLHLDGITCPSCGTTATTWRSHCSSCGTPLHGSGATLGLDVPITGLGEWADSPGTLLAEGYSTNGAPLAMLLTANGALLGGPFDEAGAFVPMLKLPMANIDGLPTALALAEEWNDTSIGWKLSAHIDPILVSSLLAEAQAYADPAVEDGSVDSSTPTTEVFAYTELAAFAPAQTLGVIVAGDPDTGTPDRLVVCATPTAAGDLTGVLLAPDGTYQTFKATDTGAGAISKPYQTLGEALKKLYELGGLPEPLEGLDTAAQQSFLKAPTQPQAGAEAPTAVPPPQAPAPAAAGAPEPVQSASAWQETPVAVEMHTSVSSSSPKVTVAGFVDGPLAVYESGGSWVVGHVGSGYPLAGGFFTKEAAISALGVAKASSVSWAYSSKGELKADAQNFQQAAALGQQLKALAAQSQPVPATAPAAAAPSAGPYLQPENVAAIPFPTSAAGLVSKQVLGGYTSAQLVQDPASGVYYVQKLNEGKAPWVKEEGMAFEAYRALGTCVPETKVYPGSPTCLLSRYVPGTKPFGTVLAEGGPLAEKARAGVWGGFAADVLLANRDVVGNNANDAKQVNMLVDPEGNVYRIDAGGALRRKGAGGLKPDFDGWPLELWAMRGKISSVNSTASTTFQGLGIVAIAGQIAELEAKHEALMAALPEKAVRETVDLRLQRLSFVRQVVEQLAAAGHAEAAIDAYVQQVMLSARSSNALPSVDLAVAQISQFKG